MSHITLPELRPVAAAMLLRSSSSSASSSTAAATAAIVKSHVLQQQQIPSNNNATSMLPPVGCPGSVGEKLKRKARVKSSITPKVSFASAAVTAAAATKGQRVDKENQPPQGDAIALNATTPVSSSSSMFANQNPFGFVSSSSSAAASVVSTPMPVLMPKTFEEEYLQEIHSSLRHNEERTKPSEVYMSELQNDVNAEMRLMLVDWMVEVAVWFGLQDETMFLAVNYVDRYLSKKRVDRNHLQLLGTSALFLASKNEEIFAPPCADFAAIMQHTSSQKAKLTSMEVDLANVLKFSLAPATSYTFLTLIMQAEAHGRASHGLQPHPALHCSHPSELGKEQMLALQLCELTLMDYEVLCFKPSLIACSCLCLAKRVLQVEPWNTVLEDFTHYQSHDLTQCVERIYINWKATQAGKYKAIYKKHQGQLRKKSN